MKTIRLLMIGAMLTAGLCVTGCSSQNTLGEATTQIENEATIQEQGPKSVQDLALEDGVYSVAVTLEGGSGRASIQTPTKLRIEDGKAYLTIVWSSANYDYMIVDDVKYEWNGTEEFSTYEIPVASFDSEISIIGDTTAMSEPHEIAYTIYLDSTTIQEQQSESQTSDEVGEAISFEDLKIERSMELQYANQFQVDYYESGYALITIEDSGSFLMIPKGMQTPQNVPEQITILKQPENIYLLSTSVMDLFRAIDGLDCIKLTGTKESDWYIEEARAAMESGDMVYAGKYNAPDYELILSKKCDLALENTMILHNPEVKEQLEHLGIPVIIERSSYEGHPLGRMEWVKLYGVLLGKEQEAEAFFDEQLAHLNETIANEEEKNDVTGGEKKTVAFFYITSNGAVNVRKSGDYVSKMIDMAGGEYVFRDLVDEEENALSTMRIQMEAFYAGAKDADYLIYNSTIDGEIKNLDMLIQKSELLKDFKAVKNGNVWCTEKSMFQESTGIAEFIVDMHRMMYEENPEDLQYMFQLK